MVIVPPYLQRRQRQQAFLIAEMVVALTILGLTLIPLAFSFARDNKLCQIYYYQSIAMEIVDGEMEILQAGEWREFAEGTHPYEVHSMAATNLPEGQFTLTVQSPCLRLEWVPKQKGQGGKVIRQTRVKP